MILPISSEPDEIVATLAISLLLSTFLETDKIYSLTALAAFSIPSRINTGFAPRSTWRKPFSIIL